MQSHRESNTLTIEERPKRDARHTGIKVGKCKILSWQKQVVAEGTVVSTDPDCLVHFKKLGPDGCKVWVDVAVDPEAFLWRLNLECLLLEKLLDQPWLGIKTSLPSTSVFP